MSFRYTEEAEKRGPAPILGDNNAGALPEDIGFHRFYTSAGVERPPPRDDFCGDPKSTTPKEDWKCPICLLSYDEHHGSVLPCGHGYHRKCIARHAQAHATRRDATCPFCRADIPDIIQSQLRHFAQVLRALELGLDVNQASNTGTTPLILAAAQGRLGMVKLLAGKGPDEGKANVNEADNNGATPLFMAAQKGLLDVVKWLGGKGPDKGGADVNQATTSGATPLYIATQKGRLDVVKWFTKHAWKYIDPDSVVRAYGLAVFEATRQGQSVALQSRVNIRDAIKNAGTARDQRRLQLAMRKRD